VKEDFMKYLGRSRTGPMKPVTTSTMAPVTSYVKAGMAGGQAGGTGFPPIEISVLNPGHHDHSNSSWKKFADTEATTPYEKCFCWKSPFLAFEGLWQFMADMEHPEVVEMEGRARSGGYMVQLLAYQVVEFFYALLLKNGQVEYRKYLTSEYLPIESRTGATDFDPHWGAEKASDYCGFFAWETVMARAAMVAMPVAMWFPPVHVVGHDEKRGSSPTGMTTQPGSWEDHTWPPGITEVSLKSERPWAVGRAAYSPFHCFDPWFTPGSNIGPNVPGRRPGTETKPPRGLPPEPPKGILPPHDDDVSDPPKGQASDGGDGG
jgi:hypothetical protein